MAPATSKTRRWLKQLETFGCNVGTSQSVFTNPPAKQLVFKAGKQAWFLKANPNLGLWFQIRVFYV